MSFATYLLHPLVYSVVKRVGLPAPVTMAATIGGTVVASWCTYRFFEMPARTFIRDRLATRP